MAQIPQPKRVQGRDCAAVAKARGVAYTGESGVFQVACGRRSTGAGPGGPEGANRTLTEKYAA